MERPGRVFSREQLLDGVWGSESISTSAPSTCMSAACARRSTAATSTDPIRTVRGAGYSLDDRFGKASCKVNASSRGN